MNQKLSANAQTWGRYSWL